MVHSSFELIRSEQLPSLNLVVDEYRHRKTGARHFHLDSGDANNAFLVAFSTAPQDSTGVAHILEHTTLCGSRHYPVRDPFFMMLRRSLNTFMNAFTASDWTAYPFATQNRKDFDNLLRVYLDAVFFPNLDPLDFAQEGHRLEFSSPNDRSSELVYRGVVYNEMKGAMSSPIRQVWQSLQSELFPTTTYHYNSGGDPTEIPKLTYEQLRAFHALHYHPANAVFMTYGNFPVTEHQQRVEECALGAFEQKALHLQIPDESRYAEPIVVDSSYAIDPDESPQGKTHVVMGWLLGNTTVVRELMNARLLTDVLLDNSASPLLHALETSKLGSAPSELCGLDDEGREAVFACGLEGSDPEKSEAIERLVLGVLEDVAEHGVPREQVESVLHQLELRQREIGGGRFPYGLQLMVRALPAIVHGGDPVPVLDIDPVLSQLREEIKDPEFIKSLTVNLLVANRHRVRLTMAADRTLSERREAEERERLRQIKARLTEQEIVRIVGLAHSLKSRQEAQDPPDVLPTVGVEDVPETREMPQARQDRAQGVPLTSYGMATNGLVYQQLIIDLPALEEGLIDYVPLFCDCITEVGCGARDYRQTQAWQASVSGGISARASVCGAIGDTGQLSGLLVLEGKALTRNQEALAELLLETFESARFDELPRLRELVAQIRAEREAQVTDHGHLLAMTAATAGVGPCGALLHRWDGLDGLGRLKKLDQTIESDAELKKLAQQLERLRELFRQAYRQILVVADPGEQDATHNALDALRSHGSSRRDPHRGELSPASDEQAVKEGWVTSTEVNFCAKAYPTVAYQHPDAPALTVLGQFLRNGFLHRKIREQGGAYGAGAGYSGDSGAFRFFSYRDPRLDETLADFDHSLEWLQRQDHRGRDLEEAILGIIREIDHPDSPAGEAINTFINSLHGRSPERRLRFRKAVLGVSLDDLRRVASQYLRPSLASVAVISNPTAQHSPGRLELDWRRI